MTRRLLRLNPGKIQAELDQLTIDIEAKWRTLRELKRRCDNIKGELSKKRSESIRLTQQLSQSLAPLGLSTDVIERERQKHEERHATIDSRLSQIDKALRDIKKRTLSQACLIATTLTKTFISQEFPDALFDVLIIDESSMAPLPFLYWAASKVSAFITVVGDFKQLPPICISDDNLAQKWLGRSIFDHLEINDVNKVKEDERVTLLDTQYRMAPEIAEIPNRLFYGGHLLNYSSTKDKKLTVEASLGGVKPIVLVDTTGGNPWCSRLSTGGRFNIYSALVSASIAKELWPRVKDSLKLD